MALIVHELKDRVPDMEIGAVRFLWMWAFSLAACVYRNVSVWGPADARLRGGLVLRGVVGFSGMTCYFYSLTHMRLADATCLSFTFPMWAALLGAVALRERLTRKDLVTLLACAGGVLLIARPPWLFPGGGGSGDAPSPPGLSVVIALVGAFAAGATQLTIRALSERVDTHVIVHAFGFAGAALAPLAAVLMEELVIPSVTDMWLLLGVGFTGWLGQVFIGMSLAREAAARATMMRCVR